MKKKKLLLILCLIGFTFYSCDRTVIRETEDTLYEDLLAIKNAHKQERRASMDFWNMSTRGGDPSEGGSSQGYAEVSISDMPLGYQPHIMKYHNADLFNICIIDEIIYDITVDNNLGEESKYNLTIIFGNLELLNEYIISISPAFTRSSYLGSCVDDYIFNQKLALLWYAYLQALADGRVVGAPMHQSAWYRAEANLVAFNACIDDPGTNGMPHDNSGSAGDGSAPGCDSVPGDDSGSDGVPPENNGSGGDGSAPGGGPSGNDIPPAGGEDGDQSSGN